MENCMILRIRYNIPRKVYNITVRICRNFASVSDRNFYYDEKTSNQMYRLGCCLYEPCLDILQDRERFNR